MTTRLTTKFFRLTLALVAIVLFSATLYQPVEAAPSAQTWVQTWSDEFNGAAGTQPSSSNWNFEQGGHGWGNNELQYYTNRASNVSMDGAGNLRIIAIAESGGFNCHYGTCRYTSARITTAGKREQTYGRFEARIRLPTGQGLWPAFWMLGNNIGSVGWPQSGEIDIMENKGSQPNTTSSALHGPGYSGATPLNHSQGLSSAVTNYHIYAMEWDTTEIRFYIDGAQHYRVTQSQVQQYGNWVFNHPFFFILNLAVGGNFDGNPGSNSYFPATMYIDYVRMFTRGGTVPTNTPGSPTRTNTPPPSGSISTTAWYNIVNQNSNKCLDDANFGTTNGSIVHQWACTAGINQQWQFQSVGSGYYRIASRQAPSLVIDVSGPSTADGAQIHLWSYVGGTNQQWTAQSLGNGYYRFVARHSGKCIDISGASTADGAKVQQWTCNGTAAQAFRLVQR